MGAGDFRENSWPESPAPVRANASTGGSWSTEQQKFRVRIRFRKVGNLRWIGHRDLVRTIERVFRRTGVRFATSQGYHPKPLMTFPSALPLGIEGWNEVGEVTLAEPVDLGWLIGQLNQKSVEGLCFNTIRHLPPRAPKPEPLWCVYTIRVDTELRRRLSTQIEELNRQPQWSVVHGRENIVLNLKEHLNEARLTDDELWLSLRPSERGGPTVREVLSSLGLADYEKDGGVIVRADILLVDECHGGSAPAAGSLSGLQLTAIPADSAS